MSLKNLLCDYLQKRLFLQVYPTDLADDVAEMDEGERAKYVLLARELLRNKVFRNELLKMENAAGRVLIRQADGASQIAWHRGGVHYIESFMSRIKFVANLEIKEPPVDEEKLVRKGKA